MVVEEINLFKDFGPVVALIIIMVTGGKWILQKAFDQVETARTNFTDYVQGTEKEHTIAMGHIAECVKGLSVSMEQHIRSKDEFINTINDQRKTINELFEMLKDQIKTNR